jgi:predicted RNase H-like HicB family nuclease
MTDLSARLNEPLTVLVHDEGSDGMWAEVKELPGCFASGTDLDELYEALEDAIGLYLSTDDNRVEVKLVGAPEPSESIKVTHQRVAVC